MEPPPSPSSGSHTFSSSPTPDGLFDSSQRHGLWRSAKKNRRMPSASSSSYQSPASLSPYMSSAIPTPLIPGHMLSVSYGSALADPSYPRQSTPAHQINPIYMNPLFLQYREKQEQKNGGDPKQKWPKVLEDAFLDGTYRSLQGPLLLI